MDVQPVTYRGRIVAACTGGCFPLADDLPTGWMADAATSPAARSRSRGSSLGAKLRPFCDGTKVQYPFK
jgi:hypothetical protein